MAIKIIMLSYYPIMLERNNFIINTLPKRRSRPTHSHISVA